MDEEIMKELEGNIETAIEYLKEAKAEADPQVKINFCDSAITELNCVIMDVRMDAQLKAASAALPEGASE